MSRETLSSLHIEPVDTDEYNRSLIIQLSSQHKRQLLQSIRREPNFLNGKTAIKASSVAFRCSNPMKSTHL